MGNCILTRASCLYPVGSIYMNVNNTNPSKWFGGTWTQVGSRLTIDSRVYGNGKAVGFTNNSKYAGMYVTSDAHVNPITGDFNKAVGASHTSSSDLAGSITGVPTKAQITAKGSGYEDATGLTTDYITCYIWKRTA